MNNGNGGVRLCVDCFDGCGAENGASDTSDPNERAEYAAEARECFQRAVNKGGRIAGYVAQPGAAS